MMVYVHHCETPLGRVLLASDGDALTGLWFDGQKHEAEGLPAEREEADLPVFRQAAQWLDAYFAGQAPEATPKLKPAGTDFRLRVWERLRAIPCGETRTYGALAAELGMKPNAARAVGNAVAHNPISLMIPCHRILGSDGSLTGYAGGLDRKRALLKLEKALGRVES